jgi:hypothetical protein
LRPTNHEVIKHTDVDERQRLFQALSDMPVRPGWVRSILTGDCGEDHRSCILYQGGFHDLPGVNAAAVNDAAEELAKRYDTVPAVAEESGKTLVLKTRKLQNEVVCRSPRFGNRCAGIYAAGYDLAGLRQNVPFGDGAGNDVPAAGFLTFKGGSGTAVLL